jgi:hypothetical protein
MRRTKPGKSLTNEGSERVGAKKLPAGWEPGDLPESDADTYGYATRAVFCDPETGRCVPATVGIAVSERSVMIWLKHDAGPMRCEDASHRKSTKQIQ